MKVVIILIMLTIFSSCIKPENISPSTERLTVKKEKTKSHKPDGKRFFIVKPSEFIGEHMNLTAEHIEKMKCIIKGEF